MNTVYRYRIEFEDGTSLVEEAYNVMDAVMQACLRIDKIGKDMPKIKFVRPAPIATQFMEYLADQSLHG